MAVDAMLAVKTVNPRGDSKYPVKSVNVLKAHGKSLKDSQLIRGYALNCTVASQGLLNYYILLTVSHENAYCWRQDCMPGYQFDEGSYAFGSSHRYR